MGDNNDINSQIDTIVGSSPTNQPGGQTTWPVRFINAPNSNLPIIGYRGSGLVGFSNNVEENQYQITDGFIRDVYSRMNPAERQTILGTLKKKGYYGRGNVGDPQYDLNAIGTLLDEANLAGLTYERYLRDVVARRENEGGGGGAARRYRVSNSDDLKVVFKRVAEETIGRGFTDAEAMQAVQAYQQREIAAQQALYGGATTVTEAPSADVFAQQFAQQVAPTEANGYKFLGLMNRIFSATGGR